jgi:lysophospholipase L1-like esterase
MAQFRSGVRSSREQVSRYATAWAETNTRALADDGPLWVVLGDSAAQGVGASAFDRGYVGQVLAMLRDQDPAWRVVNLAVSGARIAGVLTAQMPRLAEIPHPDLVTCAAGANDLIHTRLRDLLPRVRDLIGQLPAGAVLANMPQGLGRRRALAVNRMIEQQAPAAGLRVADVWSETGPPWDGNYASDHFHPSDRGYRNWARAFARVLELSP